MKEELRVLAQYRLRRGHESLKEAEVLLREGALKGAINRAYYSMFYAASAILAIKELGSSKHAGVISLLHKEFVKPGLFPAELASFLEAAFQQRVKGDYRDFVVVKEEEVKDLFEKAQTFVKGTEEILKDLIRD